MANDFSLPVNVPWRRLIAPLDMILNANSPTNIAFWKPSLAISYYLVPKADTDQELICDQNRLLLLKVSLSITGVRNQLESLPLASASDPALNARLISALNQYFSCVGALLELSIVPQKTVKVLDELPYVVDVVPRTRELIESAQIQTSFLEASDNKVGVLKSGTEGSEWSASLKTKAGFAVADIGVSAEATTGYSHSSQDVHQSTTDSSREKRESLAYTLNLNHVYELYNAYHVGTNRSAVVVQPRPHRAPQSDDPAYFRLFNGLRTMEGIQDILFIVAIPPAAKSFCVHARLLTGHLVHITSPSSPAAPQPAPEEPTCQELVNWANTQWGESGAANDFTYWHTQDEEWYHVHVVDFYCDGGQLKIRAYRQEKSSVPIEWFPEQIGDPDRIKQKYIEAHPFQQAANPTPAPDTRGDDGIVYTETTLERCAAINDDKLQLDAVPLAPDAKDKEVAIIGELRTPYVGVNNVLGPSATQWIGLLNFLTQRVTAGLFVCAGQVDLKYPVPFSSTGVARDLITYTLTNIKAGESGDIPISTLVKAGVLKSTQATRLSNEGVKNVSQLFSMRLGEINGSLRRIVTTVRKNMATSRRAGPKQRR